MPASLQSGSATSAVFHWFAGQGWWARSGMAVLAGALMTAGHPPVSLPWALFLGVPVIVLLVATAETGRAAAWIGWAAAFGYFVTGLHWIGHAFVVDADRFGWLMPLGVIAFPAGLGLFWAAAFWLARRLWSRGPLDGIAVLILVWTAAEYARGHVLTGFPWGLPGYVWVDTPPMQVAAWVGPWGVTFLTLLVTASPVLVFIGGRVSVLGPAFGLLLGASLWITGSAQIPDRIEFAPDAPVIRLVQPNAPQALKWQPGYREQFYERALEATAAEPDPALGPPDVIIWPEASVYFVPAANPDEVRRIADAANGATVFLGALHGEQTSTGPRWNNSMVTILPDGRLGPRYDKYHLVPFGEYMPMKPVMDALGLSQFGVQGDMEAGSGPETLTIGDLPPVRPLVCYEAIFPGEIATDLRPAWMVQPTNDAWFGSGAGPLQHYAQARIRTIEQGVPIVRAANTGISAVVDAYGREVVSAPLNNFSYIDAELPVVRAETIYSRFGDWTALFLIALSWLTYVLARFIGRRY
ncbi:MAG: apolipoprotein N-acyltransferase [Pseudomonadota bacterium]